jgi:hypothetical protein
MQMEKTKGESFADRRASHNAIERARRESLNGRFVELANSIPMLQGNRKPSKAVIVTKALEYIQECKHRMEMKNSTIMMLRKQNEDLLNELNILRTSVGMGPLQCQDVVDLDSLYEMEKRDGRNAQIPNSCEAFEEEEEEDVKSLYGSLASDFGQRGRTDMSGSVPDNMFRGPYPQSPNIQIRRLTNSLGRKMSTGLGNSFSYQNTLPTPSGSPYNSPNLSNSPFSFSSANNFGPDIAGANGLSNDLMNPNIHNLMMFPPDINAKEYDSVDSMLAHMMK